MSSHSFLSPADLGGEPDYSNEDLSRAPFAFGRLPTGIEMARPNRRGQGSGQPPSSNSQTARTFIWAPWPTAQDLGAGERLVQTPRHLRPPSQQLDITSPSVPHHIRQLDQEYSYDAIDAYLPPAPNPHQISGGQQQDGNPSAQPITPAPNPHQISGGQQQDGSPSAQPITPARPEISSEDKLYDIALEKMIANARFEASSEEELCDMALAWIIANVPLETSSEPHHNSSTQSITPNSGVLPLEDALRDDPAGQSTTPPPRQV